MTLIVARVNDNELEILSDTKITDECSVRNNPLSSNLKIFILNPKTCVAFSGNVYYAEKFLEYFYSLKLYNFFNILESCLYFNRISNSSPNSTDFGAAYIDENEIIKLYKIKDGKIESELNSFWLGDKLAFEEYQKNYFAVEENKDVFHKMSTAFKKVVSEGKIETVGNFTIGIDAWTPKNWKEKILGYKIQANATLMPGLMSPIQTNTIEYIPQGEAKDGGYSECFLRSLTLELPAIAIHFHQGKFGVLFCPALNYNHPIVIKDIEDGKEFANYVKREYNILLHGYVVENGSYFKEIIGE